MLVGGPGWAVLITGASLHHARHTLGPMALLRRHARPSGRVDSTRTARALRARVGFAVSDHLEHAIRRALRRRRAAEALARRHDAAGDAVLRRRRRDRRSRVAGAVGGRRRRHSRRRQRRTRALLLLRVGAARWCAVTDERALVQVHHGEGGAAGEHPRKRAAGDVRHALKPQLAQLRPADKVDKFVRADRQRHARDAQVRKHGRAGDQALFQQAQVLRRRALQP
mmetsp:Transcript_31819/g.98467  ORF Transcript_31819/g.98467 Transcript_31819/m.98467 type:complete len:225 (+) Transcript_31819:669-1343(+)